MQEQRHVSRHRVECPVAFVIEEVEGTGTVFNLSDQGCAVESTSPVPMQGYASLSITIPDDPNPVVVDLARVCWVTRTDFGLEFRILSRTARTRLQRFLCVSQSV